MTLNQKKVYCTINSVISVLNNKRNQVSRNIGARKVQNANNWEFLMEMKAIIIKVVLDTKMNYSLTKKIN